MKIWSKLILIFIAACLLTLVIILLPIEYIKSLLRVVHTKIELLGGLNPLFLIAIMAILPTFPVPLSIFYIAAGIAYGIGWGLFYSTIGIAINIALSYWVITQYCRGPVLRFLRKKGHEPDVVPSTEHATFTLAIRLMPGLPYFIQNFILSFSGIPFRSYFWFSLLAEIIWAILFILIASASLEKSMATNILIIFGVIVFFLIIKILRTILARKKLRKEICKDLIKKL